MADYGVFYCFLLKLNKNVFLLSFHKDIDRTAHLKQDLQTNKTEK